jgi:hypothetical protein
MGIDRTLFTECRPMRTHRDRRVGVFVALSVGLGATQRQKALRAQA